MRLLNYPAVQEQARTDQHLPGLLQYLRMQIQSQMMQAVRS
jgi:hypothetical protein